MNKLDKKWAEALTKTLHAYENLIADFEGNIAKWKSYGSTKACRLCRVRDTPTARYECDGCPIKSPRTKACGRVNFDSTVGSLIDLRFAIQHKSKIMILEAARARYKSILQVIKLNGWTYE